MVKIIQFLIDNLYYTLLVVALIFLVVAYFIGSKKKRDEERVIREQLEESKIDAPKTKKRFVQGQIIKEQDLSINHKE